MLTNILDYLRHSAEKHGDKTAFSDSTHSVTYRGLDALSDSIASFLMTKIPGKNEPAAVLIDRNIQSVVSFMGIVKSGNFYVPVDSQLPPKRIAVSWKVWIMREPPSYMRMLQASPLPEKPLPQGAGEPLTLTPCTPFLPQAPQACPRVWWCPTALSST